MRHEKITEELLKILPSSWKELKLRDYKKLTAIELVESDALMDEVFVGADNAIKIISALTDTPVEIIESLPIPMVSKLVNKINFIQELPEIQKDSVIKWKEVDEISYSDYTYYQSVSGEVFQNIELIIKSFMKNEMTAEELLELDMETVHTGFFILKKTVRRYLSRMIFFTSKKYVKQIVKENFPLTRSNLSLRRKKNRL